jgi:hypothetical protein
MIDTIVLRLHNVKQYPEVLKKLRKEDKGTAYFNRENPHNNETIDKETGEIFDKDSYLQVKQIEFSDTGKTWTLYKNKVLTSSHYYLSYRIDFQRDLLEFNFSIPKYIYGTNIVQFIPHLTEKFNTASKEVLETLEYNISNTYYRLMTFIDHFINEWLKGVEIDKGDIEINRLDIAFNQIFDSKDDAMKYLEYQKRIKKKYIRETSKNKTDWNTSIFLSTERYGAKIYHKGTEYKSSNGERKHHTKINRKNNEEVFKTEDEIDKEGNLIREGLQSFSDRILRYEITFRASYMSFLFRKHLFAKDCPFYKALEKEYKEVRRIKKRCEQNIVTKEQHKRLTANEKIDMMMEYVSLPKEKKDNHRLYEEVINKRCSFRLEISEDERIRNTNIEGLKRNAQGKPILPNNALFTKELLYHMFTIFTDFMKEFEVKKLDKFSDATQKVILYNQKIEEYNQNIENPKERKTKLNELHINQILYHIQTHTLDEMVQLKLISRRTKYNYKKTLEKIGYTNKHIGRDMNLTVPELDFERYIEYSLSDRRALSWRNNYYT